MTIIWRIKHKAAVLHGIQSCSIMWVGKNQALAPLLVHHLSSIHPLPKVITFPSRDNRNQVVYFSIGWPRRVQLNRLSSAVPLHYDQSSRNTENSDPVGKTGFLCLRSRRVEQSSSICPHRKLQLVLPLFSQNSVICSSLRLTINVSIFLFYHFWLCNARSAGFNRVWLGTITFYHIIIIKICHVTTWLSSIFGSKGNQASFHARRRKSSRTKDTIKDRDVASIVTHVLSFSFCHYVTAEALPSTSV